MTTALAWTAQQITAPRAPACAAPFTLPEDRAERVAFVVQSMGRRAHRGEIAERMRTTGETIAPYLRQAVRAGLLVEHRGPRNERVYYEPARPIERTVVERGPDAVERAAEWVAQTGRAVTCHELADARGCNVFHARKLLRAAEARGLLRRIPGRGSRDVDRFEVMEQGR